MYVDVPPVHDASNVIVLPTFCVDGSVGVDVSVGIPMEGLTVTSEFILLTVSGVRELSVTNMQYQVLEVGLTGENEVLPGDNRVCTNVLPELQVEVAEEYSFAV